MFPLVENVLPRQISEQMNQISTIQNSETQLERLAAQRELYSSAKNYYLFELMGSVMVPVILTAISVFFTNISLYSALYGICFYLFDSLIIEPLINERKTKAAKIQELFDCDVLEIEKSPFKSVSDITVEEVLTHYDAHKKIETNIEKIKDWYPKEVGELDISIARLICQRMNYGWDAKLRKSFSHVVKTVTVLLSIMIIIGTTVGRLPGEQLPLILSGILPLFRFCLKLHQDNKSSTEKLTKLNAYFESLWARILKLEVKADELYESARRIQDEIYDNRTKSPLIPDFSYKFYRSDDESLMARSAKSLAEDFKKLKDGGKNELKN
jgi:uncharacterized membrane protein YagU involved in acid resistance